MLKKVGLPQGKRSYTIGLQTLQVIDVQLLLKEATKSARFSSVGIFSFLRNRCRAIFTLSGEMPINSAISFMLRLRPMSEQSFRSLWLRSGYCCLSRSKKEECTFSKYILNSSQSFSVSRL